MRNIISLLYKYNGVLLFIVLEVGAFALIVKYNHYQKSAYLNSSNSFLGWFKDISHSVSEPFSAMEENERLRKENARLKAMLPENFYRLERNEVVINDTLYEQQFTYIPTQVIDNPYRNDVNYLQINSGSDKGVQVDMGVVGPDGLIGYVRAVSPKYAVVTPIINTHSFFTDVMLSTNHHFGRLYWDGGDPGVAQIDKLSKTVPVEPGDTIVTKGAQGRFPPGIPVGTIKYAREVAGKEDYDVAVDLFTDFKSLHHAYVVINHHKLELIQLNPVDHD